MKKTLPLLAIALALSVNAYAVQIRQIADGQYSGEYNGVKLNTVQTKFNAISAKESGGVDVGMVVVWNRAENPLNWEKWMECNGATTPEEQAKLLNSDMCKDYHVCTVPDFSGRFLRQQGGLNGGTVGDTQEDAGRNITATFVQHGSAGFLYTESSSYGAVVVKRWKYGCQENTAAVTNGYGFDFDASREYGTEHTANEFRPSSFTVRYLIRVNE